MKRTPEGKWGEVKVGEKVEWLGGKGEVEKIERMSDGFHVWVSGRWIKKENVRTPMKYEEV